jgi:hypothetical protein
MFAGAITKLETGWRLAEGALRPAEGDFTLAHYKDCLVSKGKRTKAKEVDLDN